MNQLDRSLLGKLLFAPLQQPFMADDM